MKLGVVIVTYNRLVLLQECVEACIKQEEKFDKILIINNASTDGTTEYLENLKYENVIVINSTENLGGAGGFYKGIEQAQKYDLDYLLLIDDDAILDSNYNKEIVKQIKEDNGKIKAYSGSVKTDGKIQKEHRKHLKPSFKCVESKDEEYQKISFSLRLYSFSSSLCRFFSESLNFFILVFSVNIYSLDNGNHKEGTYYRTSSISHQRQGNSGHRDKFGNTANGQKYLAGIFRTKSKCDQLIKRIDDTQRDIDDHQEETHAHQDQADCKNPSQFLADRAEDKVILNNRNGLR